MKDVYMLPLGELGANCYIIPAAEGKAVVIDPASATEVIMFLQSNGLTLGSIVLTHGHFDHFAGVAALKEQTGAEVIAPAPDAEMLESAAKSWADFMPHTEFRPVVPDRTFSDGEEFSASGVEFKVMAAPGHTAGSCLLFCKTLGNVIFSGDVLFRGAIGRTDGYSGSRTQMKQTLHEINLIEGDYTIYCGHGEPTTLFDEKKYNPYIGAY